MFHFNWGWYGNCNGYYAANVFDTQSALSYDGENNTAVANFDRMISLQAIYPHQ